VRKSGSYTPAKDAACHCRIIPAQNPLPSHTTLKSALPVEHVRNFKLVTRGRWDPWSPLAILGLSTIGVCFIYSAQFSKGGSNWVQQLMFLAMGALLYLGVSLIDYRFWLSVAHWFYAACMLPLVLIFFVGSSRFGAQRWIDLGFFSFQPSETAKVAVLLMVAAILMRSELGTVKQSLGALGKLALAVGFPMVLILLQPDLKSAIVLPPLVLSMLYVSRLSLRFFACVLGAIVVLVSVVLWDVYRYADYMEANKIPFTRSSQGAYEPHSWLPYLHDYQRNRVLAFVAPEKIDPTGTGNVWNLRQSLISIGSGGLTGKGWTQGTQAQLGYLPPAVAHNDFIFSVIAEEKGFIGSLSVIGLFGILLFNGIRIASIARDRLGTLLAVGVTVIFSVHMFVNVAMTIGMVPITGIPLPFISYGGTFVLSCCLLQGLVQSVYRFRKDFS
jgi:rod shape determining protein RodA